MKKAFTLIELMAILIILGVILMIIIPITNNAINSSRQEVYEEQVNKILDQSLRYSTEVKLGYENNNYKTITFEDLIDAGIITEVPENPLTNDKMQGCVVYSWKEDIQQYEFKYEEDCNPNDDNELYKVNIDLTVNKPLYNGYYNENFTVDVTTNGDSYKYCIGTNCTPDQTGSINISTTGTHTVCAIAQRDSTYSDKLCKEFKLDNTTPTITAKQAYIILEPGTDAVVKDFFDTTFGPSGGDYTCNITNTNELLTAENTVTCTATGNNGKTATTSTIFHLNIPNLMVSGETFQSFIGNYRDTITEVNFLSTISGKYDSASIKWDLSLHGNNVVLGYIEEVDGKQILNIEANGDIIAHEELGGSCSSSTKNAIFCYFTKVETINFNNVLDTSNVINMNNLFYKAIKLTKLNVSSFDTSNVLYMSGLFRETESITNVNVENFDTSSVLDMSFMFYDMNSLIELNVSHFNTSKVRSMNWMFGGLYYMKELDLSNFDTSKVGDMSFMFASTVLEKLNISNFNTSNVYYLQGMFTGSSSLKEIDISSFNTSKAVDMSAMFRMMYSLETLNVSHFDTSNVRDMELMFSSTYKLSSLNLSNFITSKVIDMSSMFSYTNILTTLDLSNFNTSNVTNMAYMFENATSLTNLDLSNFNTSNVTNMADMFENATSLTNLDLSNFNTSNVTNMSYMFSGTTSLTNLDLSNFNTSNVTNMSYMFSHTSSLQNLNISNFNTSKVTNMSNMFNFMEMLTTLDITHFNTSNVTNMNSMFTGSNKLTNLDLSNFNTSKVTDMISMFQDMFSLKILDLSSFDMSSVTKSRNMFRDSQGFSSTTVYAKSQNEVDIFNGTRGKYKFTTIIVKP